MYQPYISGDTFFNLVLFLIVGVLVTKALTRN